MWFESAPDQPGPKPVREQVVIDRIAKFRRFIERSPKRVLALYGGARSGKSVAVAQHLAHLFATERDRVFLITRATMPALKMTCYPLLKSCLANIRAVYESNRQDMTFTNDLGNVMYFKSLDDEEKIKSFEANYIWMEEPTENPHEHFKQLLIRCGRPPATTNRLYLTFNPVNANHWTVKDIVNGTRSDVAVLHSTYRDNRFLPRELIDVLEGFKNVDDDYYRIYTLGQPGMMQNLIYQNWGTIEVSSIPHGGSEPTSYGIDWGFNNPTAILAGWVLDGVLYVHELLYRSRMTMPDILDAMKVMGIVQHVPIYADPSRPDMITELCRAGYTAKPAVNDVSAGISYLKGRRIMVSTDSVNTIQEMQTYKWGRTKDDTVTDAPVKVNDHAMDAMRYMAYSAHAESGDTSSDELGLPASTVPEFFGRAGSGIPGL